MGGREKGRVGGGGREGGTYGEMNGHESCGL